MCTHMCAYAGEGGGIAEKRSNLLDMLSLVSYNTSLWKCGHKEAKSGIQDQKSGQASES